MAGAIVPLRRFRPGEVPQTLDDEDLAFLNENYSKLTKSGVIEYDPTNGFVRCNYIVGKDVEKDVEPIWLPKKEYLTYEDPLLKGTKAKTREEAEAQSAYSLSGNTQGLIALPVPFRYFVRVEYDMFIQTMNAASSYGTVLMFDAGKKMGYAQDWAKLGTMSGGKFKPVKMSPKAEYNGPADVWHIKYRGFPYLLEYKWVPSAESKKGSGVFQFDFDVGQQDHVLNQCRQRPTQGRSPQLERREVHSEPHDHRDPSTRRPPWPNSGRSPGSRRPAGPRKTEKKDTKKRPRRPPARRTGRGDGRRNGTEKEAPRRRLEKAAPVRRHGEGREADRRDEEARGLRLLTVGPA